MLPEGREAEEKGGEREGRDEEEAGNPGGSGVGCKRGRGLREGFTSIGSEWI